MTTLNVSGKWHYTPFIKDSKVVDGITFLEAYTKDPPDRWEGTLKGTSTDIYKATILPSGAWDAGGVVLFDGVISGKKGTLVIWFMGYRPDAVADWSGNWVILRGIGELANLQGEGTWRGQGAAEIGAEGYVEYSGTVQFDPRYESNGLNPIF